MKDLYDFLTERLKGIRKLVILGAGSFLKADDAVGVIITEEIKERFANVQLTATRIYTGESAPENYTGEIKRFKPDHLLVIDAADMQEEPGSIAFIQSDAIGGVTFSTHMLPIKIMLDYLVKETGCNITIIGVQPENLVYAGEVTPKVADTANYITSVIEKVIIQLETNTRYV